MYVVTPSGNAAIAARLHQLAKARAIDELHDEEHVVAIAREIEHAHDVAVLHADQQLRLAYQALDEHVIVRELREQPLDRDRLLEAVRSQRVAREHLGHAAASEQIAQHVASLASLHAPLDEDARPLMWMSRPRIGVSATMGPRLTDRTVKGFRVSVGYRGS